MTCLQGVTSMLLNKHALLFQTSISYAISSHSLRLVGFIIWQPILLFPHVLCLAKTCGCVEYLCCETLHRPLRSRFNKVLESNFVRYSKALKHFIVTDITIWRFRAMRESSPARYRYFAWKLPDWVSERELRDQHPNVTFATVLYARWGSRRFFTICTSSYYMLSEEFMSDLAHTGLAPVVIPVVPCTGANPLKDMRLAARSSHSPVFQDPCLRDIHCCSWYD